MKIGIFTDIHNNISALEALLSHFQMEGCEEYICCGDVVGIGPSPAETVRCLMNLKSLHMVLGNHERLLIDGLHPAPSGMSVGEISQHEWEFNLLSETEQDYLKALPLSILIEREGVLLYITHYAMNPQEQYVNYVPTPTRLLYLFKWQLYVF